MNDLTLQNMFITYVHLQEKLKFYQNWTNYLSDSFSLYSSINRMSSNHRNGLGLTSMRSPSVFPRSTLEFPNITPDWPRSTGAFLYRNGPEWT